MKAIVREIELHNIGCHEAMEIIAELNSLNIVFYADKYPKLRELQQILNGLYTSMIPDVHYISKREKK